MNDSTLDWHEYRVKRLADGEEAISFLHAVMEEYERFGNTAAVMSAIETVVEAQGGISALAKQTGVAPETFLNVLFSDEAREHCEKCLGTLQTLLNTLGCRLSIEPLVQEHLRLGTATEAAAPGLKAPAAEGRHPMTTETVAAENSRF